MFLHGDTLFEVLRGYFMWNSGQKVYILSGKLRETKRNWNLKLLEILCLLIGIIFLSNPFLNCVPFVSYCQCQKNNVFFVDGRLKISQFLHRFRESQSYILFLFLLVVLFIVFSHKLYLFCPAILSFNLGNVLKFCQENVVDALK